MIFWFFFNKKDHVLTDLIYSLKDDFELRDEGGLAPVLGIKFSNVDYNTIKLS